MCVNLHSVSVSVSVSVSASKACIALACSVAYCTSTGVARSVACNLYLYF